MAVADVNGDGKADLIVANKIGNNVSVLLGNGNGNFTGQAYTIDTGPACRVHQRHHAAVTATNASSVSFTVTFSEAVTGVDPSDFRGWSETGTRGLDARRR